MPGFNARKSLPTALVAGTFALGLFALAQSPASLADGPRGVCDNRDISTAIQSLLGRPTNSSGDSGECNPQRYGTTWSNTAALRQKIREEFFTGRHAQAVLDRERCFGAQGSMCGGMIVGLGEDARVGRRTNPDGTYRIWVSVGSINHDNCCLANPNGKMCGGNPDASNINSNGNGKCVAEWDKAWWNAMDGRSWSATFDPRQVPNLELVTNPRRAYAQDGTALVPFETVATRNLKAPAGQALDVGDEEFCTSGRAEQKSFGPKRWIECK